MGDELDFVVASPEASELRRVTLRFERRWVTTAALDAWGFDTSKALAAHIRVQRNGSWSLDMQTAADPLNASQALLVLELIEVLAPPNSVALTAAGANPHGFSALEGRAAPVPPEGLTDAARWLACVEAHIGQPIAIPDSFNERSFEDLRVAAALLSGNTVEATWDQMQWPMTAAQARDLASGPLSDGPADLDVTRSWTVDLGDGRKYEIAPVLAHLHSVRVSAWPETDGLPDDALVAVVLEPADGARAMNLRLMPSSAQARPRLDRVMMADEPVTLVPPDVFEELVASLDEPTEPSPALGRAAARLRAIRT